MTGSAFQVHEDIFDGAKSIADKYVNVMNESLAKQTDVDARQCIYYCAYGATTALFEMLVALVVNTTDKPAQVRLHAVSQSILALVQNIEARRKDEAVAFEAQVGTGRTKH